MSSKMRIEQPGSSGVSERKFKLDADPECARVSVVRETAQVRRIVLDAAGSIDAQFGKSDAPREHRADPMLRFVAMITKGEVSIILDPRFEERMEAHPRLSAGQHG